MIWSNFVWGVLKPCQLKRSVGVSGNDETCWIITSVIHNDISSSICFFATSSRIEETNHTDIYPLKIVSVPHVKLDSYYPHLSALIYEHLSVTLISAHGVTHCFDCTFSNDTKFSWPTTIWIKTNKWNLALHLQQNVVELILKWRGKTDSIQ